MYGQILFFGVINTYGENKNNLTNHINGSRHTNREKIVFFRPKLFNIRLKMTHNKNISGYLRNPIK